MVDITIAYRCITLY